MAGAWTDTPVSVPQTFRFPLLGTGKAESGEASPSERFSPEESLC